MARRSWSDGGVCTAGVYTNSYDATLNARNGFPVFSTLVEANHIQKTEDLFAAYKLTDEDKAEIHALSRDPRIGAYLPMGSDTEGPSCSDRSVLGNHRTRRFWHT